METIETKKNTVFKSKRVRESKGDAIFSIVVYFILALLIVVMIYPFIYVVSTSISNPGEVIAGRVWLLPKGFDTSAYKQMIDHPLFMSAYANTIIYAASGTLLTLIFTSLAAYPLSRSNFRMKGFISKFYVFTMFFGGGMIPTYMAMRNLHILDTIWVMILPGAVGAWNMILMRSFFKTIPESLHESAFLDGANEFRVFTQIVIPLSKPVLATITLFSVVGHWNNFFSGLLYLNDSSKFPLQMILRSILINANFAQSGGAEGKVIMENTQMMSTQALKSASIVITMFPIMCIYPFIQKYFVQGIMVGSVKG